MVVSFTVTVWKVMEMCYKILGEGKLVSQRELFYKLLSESPKYFSCMRHVSQTIQGLKGPRFKAVLFFWRCIYLCMTSDFALFSYADVVSLLRCTRQSLGIMASSRRALIGRLILHVGSVICSKHVWLIPIICCGQ
jgi:meiotic recombination protein SPO11